MKKVVCAVNGDNQENSIIKANANTFGISPLFAEILYSRGLTEEKQIRRFLNPSVKNLKSPFLLNGIADATERIAMAKENGEPVLIFGDYDADGVSASTVLYKALKEYGIEELYVTLPEREEGYGVNTDIITAYAEEYYIGLVITVDCGVSDREKIDFIMSELGVDVIVTDHHEPPSILPDCIVIDPKIKGQTCFDGLCGAGVAYKLAYALIGEKADKLLDYVALATVADSMPLIDENRDIVFEGLKLFNRNTRSCFNALLGEKKNEVTSSTLAYQLAPKINAAGRMGDAKSALKFFLTDDESQVFDLGVLLTQYNISRQQECESLYREAKAMISKQGVSRRVIMLYNESWKTGFVGIVASKLVIEYARPVILFAGLGDNLKGSARSVEGVNIFDAIKDNERFLIEYGGHSQAAGISLEKDYFKDFYDGVDAYLSEHCDKEDFTPKIHVDAKLSTRISKEFIKELELLEPTGVGNKKPAFVSDIGKIVPERVKVGSSHISFKLGDTDMMWFNGDKYIESMCMPVQKQLVYELGVSTFNGKEYFKGYAKEVCLPPVDQSFEPYAFYGELLSLKKDCDFTPEFLPIETIREIASEKIDSYYGTCFVVRDIKTLEKFPELSSCYTTLYSGGDTGVTCIVVCPQGDLSEYEEIIYLDTPIGGYLQGKMATLSVEENLDFAPFNTLSVSREIFAKAFTLIRGLTGNKVTSAVAVCEMLADIDIHQALFCYAVFNELGIFYVKDDILLQDKTVKTELTNSVIYTKIANLIRA